MLPCTVEDRVILAGGVVVYVAFACFHRVLTVRFGSIDGQGLCASRSTVQASRVKAAARARACAARIEYVGSSSATAIVRSYARFPGQHWSSRCGPGSPASRDVSSSFVCAGPQGRSFRGRYYVREGSTYRAQTPGRYYYRCCSSSLHFDRSRKEDLSTGYQP